MTSTKISLLSKVLLLIISALFVGSIFVPMWQIELNAPQYPEGLVLKLHANKIGGDVEIINGLNHYIGMATLHTENFIEFKILPYVFIGFGLISLLLIFIAKRKAVLVFFLSYVLFVVLAGVDFYRWNYEYGHNLDPKCCHTSTRNGLPTAAYRIQTTIKFRSLFYFPIREAGCLPLPVCSCS